MGDGSAREGARVRAGAVLAAVAAAGAVAAAAAPADTAALIRPPGARDERDFLARCIKCGRCMEACPYRTLHADARPTGPGAGAPVVDVRTQACRLCADLPCIAACPTEALHPVASREEVRMGTAVIRRDACIAVQGMRCEVCYRACPLIDSAIAIDYRLREGDVTHAVFEPKVDPAFCTGCGLCVQRCPVSQPYPAIEIVRDEERARARIAEEQRYEAGGWSAGG